MMNTKPTNSELAANVAVYRDEIHEQPGRKPQVNYYLGWGGDPDRLGAPLSFEELQALHALIGRAIEQNTTTL